MTPNIQFTGKLLNYADYRQYSATFIETGTALGDGVQRALDAGFTPVASVEAFDDYYQSCCLRFSGGKRGVFLFYGKSTDWLKHMLESSVKQPCVIYLDAHPTGPGSAGHEEWVAGDPESYQDNIIKKELAIILEHGTQHVIIIDDVNGMADGCAGAYMDMILEKAPGYRFEFWDECLSGQAAYYYKDKILVCLPG